MMNRTVFRTTQIVVVIFAAVCYALALWKSAPTRFDDSYMFIRYANNILAGIGHAWNPDGVQVYGSTSLLHVGVVTLLKFCMSWLSDARILLLASAIPGTLAIVVLVVTCGRCSTHRLLHNQYLLWAALLLPILALNGTILYHHRTGMDTMLSMLCNATLILFTMQMVSAGSVRRVFSVVVIGYLSFLARPDNGVYATVFPALCILLLCNGPRRKLLAVFLSSMFAILVIDFVVKWYVFDSPLPLPFYAKQHGAYQGYANPDGPNPFFYLSTFLTTAMPFVCIILLLARKSTAGALAALLLPVVLTFTYYLLVNQIMGNAGRFYFPSLPFFVVSAAVVIDDRLRAAGEGGILGRKELLLRLTVMLLIVAVGRQIMDHATAWYQNTLSERAAYVIDDSYEIAAAEPLPPVDRWESILAIADIAAKAPAGTVIALSELGLIGASNPHVTLIDCVGLHDKQFALHGFSARDLFHRKEKPDLIWFPHYHYTNIVNDILRSDDFWQQYMFYPEAFDYGLAIRKESPYFDELSKSINSQWKVLYGERAQERYLAGRTKNCRD